MDKRSALFSIAFIAVGLLIGDTNASSLRSSQNETLIAKGKPTIPPCPADCPFGVYKCQEIRVNQLLLSALILTNQVNIDDVKAKNIIYANCEYADGRPIGNNPTPIGGKTEGVLSSIETAIKGKPPPCSKPECQQLYKYVCCVNTLLTLHTPIPEIGPIPAIKNLVILCRGLSIDIDEANP